MFRRSSFLIPLYILVDILCLYGAFVTAHHIRFEEYTFYVDHLIAHKYQMLFLAMSAAWIMLLFILKPYKKVRTNFRFSRILYDYYVHVITHAAVIAFIWLLLKTYYFSRAHFFYTYVFVLIYGSIIRILGILFIRFLRSKGLNIRNYVVVGYGDLSTSIVDFYHSFPDLGYKFLGYFDNKPENEHRVKGSLKNLEHYVLKNDISHIYCYQPYISNEELNDILEFSKRNNIAMRLIPDYTSYLDRGLAIEYHGIVPVININTSPFSDYRDELVKRVFDICFSLAVMITGFPVFLLLVIITKLTSKGPVFFRQERAGRWGIPFKILKFRSMYVNADEISEKLMGGAKHSQGEDDPRITSWGRFMRKTRLDEFPQFWNVFIGDLSVVGPRPLAMYDVKMIKEASSEKFELLLTMKPGVTSLGQVKFGYAKDQTENLQRMRYDLFYFYNRSTMFDLWVIFETVKVMLKREGR